MATTLDLFFAYGPWHNVLDDVENLDLRMDCIWKGEESGDYVVFEVPSRQCLPWVACRWDGEFSANARTRQTAIKACQTHFWDTEGRKLKGTPMPVRDKEPTDIGPLFDTAYYLCIRGERFLVARVRSRLGEFWQVYDSDNMQVGYGRTEQAVWNSIGIGLDRKADIMTRYGPWGSDPVSPIRDAHNQGAQALEQLMA